MWGRKCLHSFTTGDYGKGKTEEVGGRGVNCTQIIFFEV